MTKLLILKKKKLKLSSFNTQQWNKDHSFEHQFDYFIVCDIFIYLLYRDIYQHWNVYNIDINILYCDINVISILILWCLSMTPNTSLSPTADPVPPSI